MSGVDDRRIAANHQEDGEDDDRAQEEDRLARILAKDETETGIEDGDGEDTPEQLGSRGAGDPNAQDKAVP